MSDNKLKLIIVGNGLDVNMGIKTRYQDLMNFWFEEIINEGVGFDSRHNRFVTKRLQFEGMNEPWVLLRNNYNEYSVKFDEHWQFDTDNYENQRSIFFNYIFKQDGSENWKNIENWADFENIYYKVLFNNSKLKNAILTINSEFEYLKEKLKRYLIDEEKNFKRDNEKRDEIANIIIPNFYSNDYDFLFLSFNYTLKPLEAIKEIIDIISYNIEINSIQINGSLQDLKNPIIFGYGDESDPNYKELESVGNKDLMRNFKTFNYQMTSNYKSLLGYLTKYSNIEVTILGHSCGLCDKTLLQTIFNHENVKTIDPTYRKVDNDSYFQNIYNISRIMDSPALLRQKVIEKNKASYFIT